MKKKNFKWQKIYMQEGNVVSIDDQIFGEEGVFN